MHLFLRGYPHREQLGKPTMFYYFFWYVLCLVCVRGNSSRKGTLRTRTGTLNLEQWAKGARR